MTAIVIIAFAAFGISGLFWYRFFYIREKRLLNRLHRMVEQAEAGKFQPKELSEEKISLLEHQFKKFLEGSLLEESSQKKQKKAIQELISDISHQTLTPITNLKLYSEILCENAGENAEVAETIRGQTEKLDFLIQSLIKLSRMENGIIEVHPKRTEIQALFCEVQDAYKKRAESANIKLEFERTMLSADFDLKWTKEALGNIVDNALKYTRPGGKVTVRAKAYTFFVRIDVADNGISIAQEEYARIFTRFYRSLSVSEQPGVGIGLYLTREILKAQHGYVKVQSQQNIGSTFSVFLPA